MFHRGHGPAPDRLTGAGKGPASSPLMSTHAASASRPQLKADHGVERGVHGVDLGHEPPLDVAGAATDVDRRGVSLRWLGASVLTGVTGAALIGAAIYVSHDGEMTFAEVAERAVPAVVRSVSGEDRALNTARKGDKLVRSEVVALAKQSFRAPMSVRSGDREAIRVRPFVRLATNLSMTSGTYAGDIPPFNPMRLFAEAQGERFAEPPAAVSDADVSVVKRDLSTMLVEIGGPTLSDADVAAQIEEERRLANEVGRRAGVAMPAQLMLSRTLRQPGGFDDPFGESRPLDGPFSSIEVRVVPENVTTLSKIEPRSADTLFEERDVAIRKGETIETVLRAAGASLDQIRGIVAAIGRPNTTALTEGQQMRLLLGPGQGSQGSKDGRQIVRVILYGERGIDGIAAVNDRGIFVSVAPPTEESAQRAASQPASEDEDEDEGGGVRLYNSLYETALKYDLPRQTVEELIRIFGYDVDFQRRVSPGDNFELFYTFDEESGGGERPEILYAALTVGGEARRVFRFQSPDDGSVDYFDDAGRSLKKFLIRKPIAEGQLRSGFGSRRHPVLGYSRMHTGVDWANKVGTPIMAAGNGTIIKAEWESGYGRRTEIQHANGYVTSYNHQSAFARGITPGARVRQGQIIGYVGSTGLSTGPHLHYEVIVNGHFVDPMKIRVPRGRELEGRLLADFKRQREQVDALLQRAGNPNRLAQRETR
jgi:murein DD-endopeptidase MepM/ murein hydrolase activator NlpD